MRRRTFLHRGTVSEHRPAGRVHGTTVGGANVRAGRPNQRAGAVPPSRGVALGQLPTFIPFKGPTPDLPGSAMAWSRPGTSTTPKDKLFQSVKDAARAWRRRH